VDERIWIGRLSVRIESEPVQGYSAGFELRGDPQAGRLVLLSPLGSTLARLIWSSSGAELASDGETRRFESVAALTRAVTGAELPLTELFAWLEGAPARIGGWTVVQDERANGRLRARREQPAPAVEMRIVLD
jgi:outer membrane lipoprotein LolB